MASYEERGDSVRVVVSLPGRKKISETFDTMAQAKRWGEAQEKKKLLLGSTGVAASKVTNEELWEAYQDAVGSKTDSAKWNGIRIGNWCKDVLSTSFVAATTTHDINEWIQRRLDSVSPATVNRELNLMSATFTYAIKDRKWITVNPCHGCRRPEQGRRRNRPLLTPDEIKAVRLATGYETDTNLLTKGARAGACFLLALETGMRSGEILRIRPRDYWKDRRTVHVSATETGGRKGSKSGRVHGDPSRNVPLTTRAVEILDQLLATMPADQVARAGFSDPPYIVGLNDAQRDVLYRNARKRSGVEDLTFHDSKHEAATRLAKFLDVFELSHAIGTKDLKLLRDTYYVSDASRAAAHLPEQLS